MSDVVDTSFFPNVGVLDAALTRTANGVRVGDHFRERLGAKLAAREAARAF